MALRNASTRGFKRPVILSVTYVSALLLLFSTAAAAHGEDRIAGKTDPYEQQTGQAINTGSIASFNSIWSQVVGQEDRGPTDAEIHQMREMVAQEMEEGAWNVTAGTYYPPAAYAQTDEIIDIVEGARDWRANFQHHMRSENNDVIKATEETIQIGEAAGLNPVVAHIKVMGAPNRGKSEQMIDLIETANARGTYAAAEQYPYVTSQASLTNQVPKWVQDGGRQAMLDRFENPELRAQIAQEIEDLMYSRVGGPEDVYFPNQGESLADVMAEIDLGAGEATIEILIEGNRTTQYTFGEDGLDDDFGGFFQHPLVAVASDGGLSTSTTAHPRYYGTFPRALGHYGRDNGYLGLEDAVRKMTGLPATMLGMVERGFIASGAAADVTVFDPETITDRASFDVPRDPEGQYSEGVEHVIVDGQLALHNGEVTGVSAGQQLQRSGSMISRPMTGTQPVSALVSGKVDPLTPEDGSGVQTVFKAAAEGGESNGRLLVRDRGRDLVFRSIEIGKLQVADGWASATGRGKIAGEDQQRAFSMILDEKNPREGGKTTVTVDIEDDYKLKGELTSGTSRVEQDGFAAATEQASAGAAAGRGGGGNARMDIILRSGTVVDGSGEPGYVADVGINDGHIMQIGDLSNVSADHEIDASARVVAPGFINQNGSGSGSDAALPEAKSALMQGITFSKSGP